MLTIFKFINGLLKNNSIDESLDKNLNNIVFNFSKTEFSNLKIHKSWGASRKTKYSLGWNYRGNYLKAESKNAGSGLGKKVKIDINKTPFINFSWKIEKDLHGLDEKHKKGHDFAARLFVIKKTGLTPLSNRAINYVYSSNSNIGEFWSSPFTKSSINFVVSTTKEIKNEWVTVKRNVKEDFKKIHHLDIDSLEGVVIMVDTNDSGREAVSYYQNVYFSVN